ncbi:MAG TPA: DUF5663 domain-containing protein [Candidatus Saccharimonadales bacterium]|nr:DUF5663 domain-containing protein [Candidatus Saccharimonadales bacterium]
MEEFIRQLLKDAGVPESTDPEVRKQLEKDLTDRATDLVNRRLIDAMSEKNAEAFSKLLDERPDNLAVMQQFIDEHVPNKEQVAGAALLEFRALYLGAAA